MKPTAFRRFIDLDFIFRRVRFFLPDNFSSVICGLLIFASCLPLLSTELFTAAPSSHKIIWGDTLAAISRRYYGSPRFYPALAAANKISDPHLIIAGDILTIPAIADMEVPDGTGIAEPVPAVVLPAQAEPAAMAVSSEPPTVSAVAAPPQPPEFIWRKVDNTAFAVGEHLTFEIKWQFIVAGIAVMNVNRIEPAPNSPDRLSYKIVTEARSTPFIDGFFKVRDTNISYIDVESICSHTMESDISEGNFRKKENVVFDQINHIFRLSDGRTGPTEPWVQDVLSALYYVRLLPLERGAEFSFPAHSGDTTYPLSVKVLSREKVRVPAGEFDCFKLEPALKGDGVFKANGRLWVWVTADSRRMPVLMKSQVFIGSVDAVLKEYR
jgi:LysM repeat protein